MKIEVNVTKRYVFFVVGVVLVLAGVVFVIGQIPINPGHSSGQIYYDNPIKFENALNLAPPVIANAVPGDARVLFYDYSPVNWAGMGVDTAGSLWFKIGSSGLSKFMVLGSGGNLGIGTTTPLRKLDVAGIVRSTIGGFEFPDGSVQSTAATAAPGASSCQIVSQFISNDGPANCPAGFLAVGGGVSCEPGAMVRSCPGSGFGCNFGSSVSTFWYGHCSGNGNVFAVCCPA